MIKKEMIVVMVTIKNTESRLGLSMINDSNIIFIK